MAYPAIGRAGLLEYRLNISASVHLIISASVEKRAGSFLTASPGNNV